MTEQQGLAVTVKLTDGSTVEVDDVTDCDWSSHPFLVLHTGAAGVSLFQMDEVRSVTPRPPDPEDSAVIPVESLSWQPGQWCTVAPTDGRIVEHHDTLEDALRAAGVVYLIRREETATLGRLVPVE